MKEKKRDTRVEPERKLKKLPGVMYQYRRLKKKDATVHTVLGECGPQY